MTCRDEILAAFARLEQRTGREVFSPAEVLAEMQRAGTQYAPSTIRTHIVSRMCANAANHHAVVYDDLERTGHGRYRRRRLRSSETTQTAEPRNRNTTTLEARPIPGHLTERVERRPREDRMPGTPVTEDELEILGFSPHELRFRNVAVDLLSGELGSEWDTLGEVPDSAGLYAFTVEDDRSLHVAYVGMTEHLWMVTKGRLPTGEARGGQRYGRPKHAGVTRERINVLVTEQVRLGRRVRHWLRPIPDGDGGEDLRSRLLREEEALIQRWQLRSTGWNRG